MEFDIYCDECFPDLFCSGKPQAKYALIGSLWLPTAKRDDYKKAIRELRDKHRLGGEMKSRKVSPSRLEFYKELLDWFVGQGEDLRFRVIVIEAAKLNFAIYHQSNPELGFYKFYYQLLIHWLHPNNSYGIYCDYQTNQAPNRLAEMKQILRHVKPLSEIRQVQWVRSKESLLTQLSDILTGLVSARLNGTSQLGSAKTQLLEHLEARLGHAIQSTNAGEQKVNVFSINLGGGW